MADSVNGRTVSNVLKMLGFVRTLSFSAAGHANDSRTVQRARREDSVCALFSQ